MHLTDELDFRQLQVIFFTNASEYPNDKERIEQGMRILVQWIDRYATKEINKVIGQHVQIRSASGGKIN
jgi:hypothetical protein